MSRLPRLYFRIREGGAAVCRIDAENRNRRLDLQQVAVVGLRSGEIRTQGGAELSPEEVAEIETWLMRRRTLLKLREADEMHRVVEQINLAAHWAQSRASDAQLDEITDDLLLAMHDLRAVLVRRRAERDPPSGQGSA
ncbi:hypothetical protein [Roseivivax sp. CAU 1761]